MIPPPVCSAIFRSQNLFSKEVRAKTGGVKKHALAKQVVG